MFKFGNVELFPHDINFDFMHYRKQFVGISAALLLFSIAVIAFRGLNYSIDFLGGAEVNVSVKDTGITRDKVYELSKAADVGPTEVTTYGAVGRVEGGGQSFVIRLQRQPHTAETAINDKVDHLISKLKTALGPDKVVIGGITNISGKIGNEEQVKGYMALLLAFIGILLYVSLRFDSRFAPGAVICLIHDVIIALGMMTFLGKPFSVSSIAAFLTIVGYSMNDTVIVYDRIRETQEMAPRTPLVQVVNQSINQTMNRTVLTSATGLAALVVLWLFGGGAIEDFALTMFIGILVGSYSSIYVAAPLTLMMDNWLRKFGWHIKDPNEKAKAKKDPNYIPPVVLKKKPSSAVK